MSNKQRKVFSIIIAILMIAGAIVLGQWKFRTGTDFSSHAEIFRCV